MSSDCIPLTPMRRAITTTMNASALIPQFTIERSASTGQLDALRAEHASIGVRISYEDCIVAACASALSSNRELNASFSDDGIATHQRINVGVAVALEGGLVSPAILDADTLSLAELAVERKRLQEAARAGRLSREELFGATFTVSNLGPLGVERFRALVVPPQAAILAVGSTSGRLTLCLSCDHRVVDGAPAARFLGDVAAALESPAPVTANR